MNSTHEPKRAVADLEDPRLLPFLPSIYLAWADGDLTREELGSLGARIAATPELDAGCRELLGRWLDPARAPSSQELATLLATLRALTAALGAARGRTLSELGAELALSTARPLGAAERAALALLEASLGVTGREVTRTLFAPNRPSAPAAAPSPPIAAGELAALLDGEAAPLRARVRALLRQPEMHPPHDASRQAYRAWALSAARRIAADGLGGLAFPRACGGAGDAAGALTVFETLAEGDLSLLVKFGVQFGLFGGSVLQLGTPRHHRELLPKIASLELPGCFAMTETGHGSNVQDLETVALYDVVTDEFVIHTPSASARKDYIGNAALDGRMATVFARLRLGGDDHGIHAFLVPIRDAEGIPAAGVTIEDCGEKMGLEGVDNGRLAFDQVRIPRAALLDRFAQVDRAGRYTSPIAEPTRRFFTMLGTLVGGRVSIALASVVASRRGLAIAVRRAAVRRQFGPVGGAERLLLDYPSHQRRLLPALATNYALHFATRRLAERHVDGQTAPDAELEGLAAGLKALASAHATSTIQLCREACGGWGYLAASGLPRLKADTDVFATFEGDNTVLLQLLAKQLVTGLRRQFGRLDTLGLMRLLVLQTSGAVAERNPITVRRTDERHLLDLGFQRAAFERRRAHLLETLARRLKARLERGLDPFDALAECQDHAIETARAHVEAFVLAEFARAVEAAPAELATVLGNLCDLYALGVLERDRGWYLEHGDFAPEKSKAIAGLVGRLCREIRPAALALVDAFGSERP